MPKSNGLIHHIQLQMQIENKYSSQHYLQLELYFDIKIHYEEPNKEKK